MVIPRAHIERVRLLVIYSEWFSGVIVDKFIIFRFKTYTRRVVVYRRAQTIRFSRTNLFFLEHDTQLIKINPKVQRSKQSNSLKLIVQNYVRVLFDVHTN